MIVLPQMRGILRPHVAAGGVTWNPGDTNGNVALSNGNLTAIGTSGSANGIVRATTGHGSGKYYFEIRLDTKSGGANDPYLGIKPFGGSIAGNGPFDPGGDYGCFMSSPNTGHQDYDPGANLGAVVAPAWANGDVFIFALDLTAGNMWIGVNGTWDVGSPAAGTSPRIAGISGTYTPFTSVTPGSTVTAHFASASWTYSAPTGFGQW